MYRAGGAMMKALTYGLLGLTVLCIGFALADAAQVSPEAVSGRSPAVYAARQANATDFWSQTLKDTRSADRRPVLQVAFDLGEALERLRHGDVNYYGYRPFGYLGYQSDAYKGYRAPGYYGYRYYYDYPVFDPGFRFRYRL
jgi:hypothetical protein